MIQILRTISRIYFLVLILLLIGLPLSTNAARPFSQSAQSNDPLTLRQIEDSIKNRTPDNAISIAIHKRKVAFPVDVQTIERLRGLGAGVKTIQALQEISKSQAGGPQCDKIHGEVTILVANFTSLDNQNAAITEILLGKLRNATKEFPEIKVQALGETITMQQGSDYAQKVGKDNKAAIVIWGWYKKSSTDVAVNVNFEPLLKPRNLDLLHEDKT